MLKTTLQAIVDRVLKENPFYGSIHLRFYFHDGRFVKYDFEKAETIIINEEGRNGKQ
jgi:hypothetical protein